MMQPIFGPDITRISYKEDAYIESWDHTDNHSDSPW